METTVQSTPSPKKPALINALTWAVINIVIFLVVYYVKPDLMGSFAYAAIQIIIGIGLAVYFCADIRKKTGGYWSFKEALSSIFLMFFVQALIVFFFTILFAKYIEPGYVAKMKEIVSATTTQLLEKMGMDQDKIDAALAESEAKLEKQFNPGFKEALISIATMAVMYFIGALIFAAIFKKDKPIFTPESNSRE